MEKMTIDLTGRIYNDTAEQKQDMERMKIKLIGGFHSSIIEQNKLLDRIKYNDLQQKANMVEINNTITRMEDKISQKLCMAMERYVASLRAIKDVLEDNGGLVRDSNGTVQTLHEALGAIENGKL